MNRRTFFGALAGATFGAEPPPFNWSDYIVWDVVVYGRADRVFDNIVRGVGTGGIRWR